MDGHVAQDGLGAQGGTFCADLSVVGFRAQIHLKNELLPILWTQGYAIAPSNPAGLT